MPNGPRELTGGEIVDIARTLAHNVQAGGVNPQQILLTLDISPAMFSLNLPANDLWFQIVQGVHAGRSRSAGFRSDAVGRLVDAAARELQGNADLSQLAYDLGRGAQSNPAGQSAIFLSYSSRDRQAVDELFPALQNQNPNLALFQDHRSIALGRDWLEEIRTAAGSASIMACWLTGAYLNSTFCSYEVGLAESRGAAIIPILAEPDPRVASMAPAYLSRPQMLRPPAPDDYNAIARDLIDAL